MVIKKTKIIESKGRLGIPLEIFKTLNFKPGDEVYFETTRAGNLLIKKVEKKENCNEN